MSTPPRPPQVGDKLIVNLEGVLHKRVVETSSGTFEDWFKVAILPNGCHYIAANWYGDEDWGWVYDESDSKTVTNEKGGKQSKLESSLSLMPPTALIRGAEVLKAGAEKYGIDNWRNISQRDHIDHALAHVYAYLKGDTTGEDDLTNAFLRLMFAKETE